MVRKTFGVLKHMRIYTSFIACSSRPLYRATDSIPQCRIEKLWANPIRQDVGMTPECGRRKAIENLQMPIWWVTCVRYFVTYCIWGTTTNVRKKNLIQQLSSHVSGPQLPMNSVLHSAILQLNIDWVVLWSSTVETSFPFLLVSHVAFFTERKKDSLL